MPNSAAGVSQAPRRSVDCSNLLLSDEVSSGEVENCGDAHVSNRETRAEGADGGWAHLAVDDHVDRALLDDVPRRALLSLVEH